MKPLDWVAAIVLFLELPIPVYWLILHSRVRFWRRHLWAGYVFGALSAWGSAAALLYRYREQLFSSERTPGWAIGVGFALLASEGYLFYRVERELGGFRLVGHAELKGSGELATQGLYARVRHPRYTGMMAAVLGACLIAGSPRLWVSVAGWWLLVLLAVGLEERELRARFGATYVAYSKRVPRFLPFRYWPREE